MEMDKCMASRLLWLLIWLGMGAGVVFEKWGVVRGTRMLMARRLGGELYGA